MRFRIRHRTHFAYDQPAYESHNEVRLAPRNGDGQKLLSFKLEVDIPASVLEYPDAFGNTVHSVSVSPPHRELAITAESVVERWAPAWSRVRRILFSEFLAEDEARTKEHYDFLHASAYVPFSERLRRFFWSTRPALDEDVAEYATRVLSFVRDQFEYEPGTTNVSSDADHILLAGGGVCQDFAHLTIGVLRLAGIPARYVSGYLALDPLIVGPSAAIQQASHAWIEALLPAVGWTGFDPTHRGRVGLRHIRLGLGRDYGDVPPVRGVYRSAGSKQTMSVELGVSEVDDRAPERSGSGQSQQ